jgi:hypothetical protein
MLYLARHHRRTTYQHLALWDESLGAVQRTRYVTPRRHEELLFAFGPYAYLWYDPTVPAAVESDEPRSFAFPEPEVDEYYLRDSYLPGGIVVAVKKAGLIVHAGGRPVLIDELPVADVNAPASAAQRSELSDADGAATLQTHGPEALGLGLQRIELKRPGTLLIERETTRPFVWHYHGRPQRQGDAWTWPDGTRLAVTVGAIESVAPGGFVDAKRHYGGMEFADPHPCRYDVVTVQSVDGWVKLLVTVPGAAPGELSASEGDR